MLDAECLAELLKYGLRRGRSVPCRLISSGCVRAVWIDRLDHPVLPLARFERVGSYPGHDRAGRYAELDVI